MQIYENQYSPPEQQPNPGKLEFDGEEITFIRYCKNIEEACDLLNEETKQYPIIAKFAKARVWGIQIVFACWLITLEGFRKGEWQYFAANFFNPTLTPIKGTAAEILKTMTDAD